MPDTWVGMHAMQVFDQVEYGRVHNEIMEPQVAADGYRYGIVWGPRVSTAALWHATNSQLRTGFYVPFDTDLASGDFGDLGHNLAWWQANHRSWVLYNCHSDGTPTQTPATAAQLPNVVLDFSNRQAVAYQAQTAGIFAGAVGYDAVAYDIVTLDNNTVKQNGDYGCGVYTGQNFHGFHRVFSGQDGDSAWENAVVSWAAQSRTILHALPRPLSLIANNVPQATTFGDSKELALLSNVDILLDEAGFANYGNYTSNAQMLNTAQWAEYVQSIGRGVLVVDRWGGESQNPSSQQLGYSMATYLLVKEAAAGLFIGAQYPYGTERWQREYGAQVGAPCYPMSVIGSSVFTRRYTKGFTLVNNDSNNPASVALPRRTYVDTQTGSIVANPFTAAPRHGYVLTTVSTGCT